eukprot:4509520-Pleurochrysis_carterae.AAC.1
MIAFVRACTLVDILTSRPIRWLAGKATQLDDWSPSKMGRVYNLLENAMMQIADNGAYLFEPSLSIFGSIFRGAAAFKNLHRDWEARKAG